MITYLDTSAAMELLVDEAESDAVTTYLRVSSSSSTTRMSMRGFALPVPGKASPGLRHLVPDLEADSMQ